MGSSSQQTQSTTQTSPWAPQQPYLTGGFQAAQNAFNTATSNQTSGPYSAPTQFVAGMTPQQLAAFQAEISYGMNPNTPQTENSLGQSFAQEGLNSTTGALNGLNAFNPSNYFNLGNDIAGGNAYAAGANIPAQVQAAMLAANQNARDVTLPGMASASNLGANENNSREALSQGVVQRGLDEQASALSAQLQGQYYNTGSSLAQQVGQAQAGNALAALTAQAQYGGANSTLGLGALGQSIQDQGQLFNTASAGGAGLQQAAQLPLTNQQQAYQFGQASPFQPIQNEWGIVGSNQWGGTSNTNSSTTYTPSLMSQIGQGFGIAGSLFGSPFSGGSLFGGGGGNPFMNGGGSFINGVPVGSIQMNPMQQYMLAGGGY